MAHFGRICPIESCKDKCFPFLLTPFQIRDLPIWENTCLDLKNKFSSTNSTNTTLLNHQRLVCTVGVLRTIHTSEYWVVPGIKVYTEAQGLPKH